MLYIYLKIQNKYYFNNFSSLLSFRSFKLPKKHLAFTSEYSTFNFNHSSTTPNYSLATPSHSLATPNHSFSTSNHSFSTSNHSFSTSNHSFSISNYSLFTPNHSLVSFIGLVFASNKYLFQMKNYFLPRAPQHKLLIWYKVLLFSFQTLTKVILISNQIIV